MDSAQPSQSSFPRGLATGAAFCNREAQRAELAARVMDGTHTWIAAPRRYGKTSLLHQTLADLGRARRPVRSAVVDLLPTFDADSARDALLAAVGTIAAALVPSRRKLLQGATRFLSALQPRLVLTPAGPRLELSAGTDTVGSLADALVGLDRLADEEGRRACLVLDEFQQLGSLRQGTAIEAAIRHAAERAKHSTYVFAGSHRHLLEQMFTERERPLYLLCEAMTLDRIAAGDYRAHLGPLARTAWGGVLDDEVVDSILEATRRHPFYVNALCARLWQAPRAPEREGVSDAWQAIVRGLESWLASEIGSLSPAQLAVLATLARGPSEHVTGSGFLARARLAKSTAAQAFATLGRQDQVYRADDGRYRVTDPALAEYLREVRVSVPPRR